jgi:LDH2 family malate/lactate/ureidoglycolate dehydrogenase
LSESNVERFDVQRLESFAQSLFEKAGMEADKAESVARLLVLTDAMGRRTHGLAQAPAYLAEIQKGSMATTGSYAVVKDNGVASALWDGHYLPGLWLVEQAIQTCLPRAEKYGLAAVAIKRNHHIGCLAALCKIATDEGCIALITNSDPGGERVAPFGGTEALMTPNPIAMGYPGTPNAVLVDICAVITTTSMTRQKYARGELFEHAWLQDANGLPTCDPAVLEHTEPRGSLMPMGGAEYGHKGFGLSLMVEALSQGLSGHGRKGAPKRWGGSTYVQVISPEAFSGADVFGEQMDYLSDRCRSNRPVDASKPVRMPGDQAQRGISAAQRDGISYDPATWSSLTHWADKLGVVLP